MLLASSPGRRRDDPVVEVRRLTYGLLPLISTTEGALRRSAEVCLERLIVPTAPLRALVTRFDLDPPVMNRLILGRMVYFIYSLIAVTLCGLGLAPGSIPTAAVLPVQHVSSYPWRSHYVC